MASATKLPKAVSDAMATAATAVQRVAAAREVVERGRLDQPTLLVEIAVYDDEIRRLEELAKPRPRVATSPAVKAALRRRQAGRAELQKLADVDRSRCDALQQAAAAAGEAHQALLAAVASNIGELVKLSGVNDALDRVLARLRESVAARLLSLGFEDIELNSETVWLEAHESEDWGELSTVRQVINAVRHAAAAGDAPPWPGAVRDGVEARIVERWRREDGEAAKAAESAIEQPEPDGHGALALQVVGA